VAVVGAGYFGSFHCNKIDALPDAQLTAVVDVNQDRAGEVAARFGARALGGHQALSGLVDAAVVAVPTAEHHLVAADLLAAGLDLLVEKPLAANLDQAEQLCRLARQKARCLQVGHLERFNPAVTAAFERIHKPRWIRMERLGPLPDRALDVDVVFELMSHDLDILLQLTDAEVVDVLAVGSPVATERLDVVSARVTFADGLVAELTASRVSSRKVRAFSLLDSEGLLEVDLANRSLVRTFSPTTGRPAEQLTLQSLDPLLEQDRSFVDVLQNGRKPRVGGDAGRATVALAERIVACLP
jgi:predicted dehydrogenase